MIFSSVLIKNIYVCNFKNLVIVIRKKDIFFRKKRSKKLKWCLNIVQVIS